MQVYRISGVRVPVRRFEFDPVADRNCVVARRGGEQREANGRSETEVNSIRLVVAVSLLAKGETRMPQGLAGVLGWSGSFGSWLDLNVKRKLERSGRRGVVGVGTSGRFDP